ncbi:cold-shock protein [Kiloniella sp. b19]|uniref:cold-shock protein n=1 Tax=Kiloniella sp. GXU_MW_B19 TaxID=3141326 RepID=UPI0031D55F0E
MLDIIDQAKSGSAGSDSTATTYEECTARIKWFNVTKGFGFVQPGNGKPDAFLHASVLEPTGHQSLPEGSMVRCDIEAGPKGLQVLVIHEVLSIPTPPPPLEAGSESDVLEGQIKFFNGDKGYGFITLDSDPTKDVFVSARILEKSGIFQVTQGQRVRLQAEEGGKGLLAKVVELA